MKMYEVLEKDWPTILNAIIVFVSLISGYMYHKIAKRYASGNIQFVEKALSHEHLNRISEIINKASKCSDAPKAWLLAAYHSDEYMDLSCGFYELERVCAIIHDDALPPKVKETTSNQISDFLLTPKIRSFVETYKQTFPKLWSFTKQ